MFSGLTIRTSEVLLINKLCKVRAKFRARGVALMDTSKCKQSLKGKLSLIWKRAD